MRKCSNMKFYFKYVILAHLAILFLALQAIDLDLPYPKLESAKLEWWPKPAWKNDPSSYELHVTLFSFTVLDIQNNRELLNRTIDEFLKNYDREFNNWVNAQQPYHLDRKFFRIGRTLQLNLLAKMNILPNSFIFQTDEPELFGEMVKKYPPNYTEPWYLVVAATTKNFLNYHEWIKSYFTSCWHKVVAGRSKASIKFRDHVKLKSTGKLVPIIPLPHITLAKVTDIKNPILLYEILDKINRSFKDIYNKDFPLSLDQLKFSDGPLSKTLQGTAIIYKTLMLHIPWDQRSAVAIKKLVYDISETEKSIIESWRVQLHLLRGTLAALQSRKNQLIERYK